MKIICAGLPKTGSKSWRVKYSFCLGPPRLGVVPGVFLNRFVLSSTALRELGFKVADNLETIEVRLSRIFILHVISF